MNIKFKRLSQDVNEEIKAIEITLERIQLAKNDFINGEKHYLTEPAIGTYLMNFYNGIENIIKRISKEYYRKMPHGDSWHKELILLAVNPPNSKHPVITEQLKEKIGKYTNFRHRFISGYGFQLDGEKMMELVDSAEPLWMEIKKQLTIFFKKL